MRIACFREEKGIAADHLLTDELVLGWFSSTKADLVAAMIAAPVNDDEARRAAAVKLQLLEELKHYLSIAQANGRRADDELERGK